MRFENRDAQILTTIYDFDGVLSQRQLKEIFWPDKTLRSVQKRLSKLRQDFYVEWANRHSARPAPEPIYWLDWRGALVVAQKEGVILKELANTGETQRRRLEKELRKHHIHWVREPHWQQLDHDLAVNDFRIAIAKSIAHHPSLTLGTWMSESQFRSQVDVVTFKFISKDGEQGQEKRGVIPDGAFVVAGGRSRVGFLLEIDMATHDNPRFASRKIAAGTAYILKGTYKAKMDTEPVAWLVVTKGKRRMSHLIAQARKAAGKYANLFFFSTIETVMREDPLSSSIWWQADETNPRMLFGVGQARNE